MSNTLVAYFSVSGKTKHIAEEIAELTDAKVFEIKPVEAYTSADINWRDNSSRSSKEEADPNARPEIADKVEDMASYDTVFIGYPIWWHTFPRIINTFLESYDLAGKKVVPFATSGGSGIETSEKSLKTLLPDSEILSGKVFNNNPSIDVIKDWLRVISA